MLLYKELTKTFGDKKLADIIAKAQTGDRTNEVDKNPRWIENGQLLVWCQKKLNTLNFSKKKVIAKIFLCHHSLNLSHEEILSLWRK